MKATHWTILILLLLGACSFAATEAKKSAVILNDDAMDWELDVYCGKRGVRAFVPGDKFRTSLSGMLVFDSKGNGYVAAGTFIAILTADGHADVLTGHTDLSGNTDGPPGRATFGQAIDITLVNDDLLYVADAANFTLRRIQRRGGVWYTDTVAGVPGKKGHRDGPGRRALLSSVFDSVVADKNGVVYMFSGDWLRKFENGLVTTLNSEGGHGYVNGPLRKARFYHSQGRTRGLALDGEGNLYVADKVNAAIRKVDLERGVVSTLAGRMPGDPRARPRDGRAAEARFHPGGGPTTMVYDRRHHRFVIHVDDERTVRVLSKDKDGWIVRSLGVRKEGPDGPRAGTAAGLPAGVDAEGNIYLSRANHIQVLRKRKDAER
ncbi:MAG: hypothetical protein ACOC8E_06320 [Planctomycetota bacterium]